MITFDFRNLMRNSCQKKYWLFQSNPKIYNLKKALTADTVSVKTMDDLIDLFANKIIPLLDTYFLGGLKKTGLVLGSQFFEVINPVQDTVFSDFNPEFSIVSSAAARYCLKEKSTWKEEDFIQNYDMTYEA